jgi:stress-induced morphogen
MSLSSALTWLSHYCLRNKPDSLYRISSVVHFKEQMDNLDKMNFSYEKSSNDEDSLDEDNESEADEEEYECVSCKQYFIGEDRLEQHRRIYKHCGYVQYITNQSNAYVYLSITFISKLANCVPRLLDFS